MDFSALELEDVGRYELRTPAGKATGIVFLLCGPSHATRIAYENKNGKRLLRQLNKDGKASLPEDPEELFDQTTARLVALTLGWEGTTEPFSADAARKHYENRRSTVRKQILAALDTDTVFTQSSSDD